MTQNIFFDVIARDKASSTFSRIAKSSESTAARLARFGRTTGALVGFTGLTAAASGFIKVGADYVGSLNKIQALSGLTDAKLETVSKSLESQSSAFAKMGQTTGDAANGMVELVKAGLSTEKALSAVRATMVLAKAGELEVADASSLVANTLNTFSLKASQAGDIANFLANAANISSADVSDLAESLKYVAPVAASTGVSLKQTNAILAELSNSGIAASNAGTGFRKFLLSLQAPSGKASTALKVLGVEIFDAQGKMKPLSTVIGDLGKSMNGLADEKRQRALKDIFGLEGASTAQVILKNGKKGLAEYTKGIGNAGAAQKLAEASSKGFAGTLSTLRAETISTAQAAYREFSPRLDAAAKKLTKFVEEMRTGEGAGGDFVGVLRDLVGIGKDAVAFFNSIPGPVKKFGVELLVAGYAMKRLSSLSTGLGGSLAMPIARTKQFAAEMTYAETRMGAVTRVSQRLGAGLMQAAGAAGMVLLADSSKRTTHEMGALQGAVGGALSGAALGAFAGPLGAAIGGGIGGIGGALFGLSREIDNNATSAKLAVPQLESYASSLSGLGAAATKGTRGIATANLQAGKKFFEGTGLGERVLLNAILGRKKALDTVTTTLHRQREALVSQRDAASAQLTTAKQYFTTQQAIGTWSDKDREAAFDRAQAEQKVYDTAKKQLATFDAQSAGRNKLIGGLKQEQAEQRRLNALSLSYKDLLRMGIAPAVAKAFDSKKGVGPYAADVAALINKFKIIDQTQWKPIIQAAGLKPSQAVIEQIQRMLNDLKKPVQTKVNPPNLTSFLSTISVAMNAVIRLQNAGKGTPKPRTPSKPRPGPTKPNPNSRVAGQTASDMRTAGRVAGRAYGDGVTTGLENKKVKVERALDRITNLASKAAEKLADLKATKSGFLSTFSADSIFGADLETTGKSLGGLLDFQSTQAQKASQLLADVRAVAGKGLSKSLIAQLQQQGSSGAEQLHLLAGGSSSQIAQFNAQNAQTEASLRAAGLFAGNYGRGGSIDTDISRAATQDRVYQDLLKAIRGLNDNVTVIQIDSEEIIRVIKKRNKRKGVSSAGM